jgi:hypothetical protein
MAIHNSVLLDSGQAAANVFACASTNGDAITTMYFCNRNGSTTTFNLYVVPAGFEANSNNIAYTNKTITAGDTYIIDWEKLVLGPGDSIRANANVGNAIVATVSTIGL